MLLIAVIGCERRGRFINEKKNDLLIFFVVAANWGLLQIKHYWVIVGLGCYLKSVENVCESTLKFRRWGPNLTSCFSDRLIFLILLDSS